MLRRYFRTVFFAIMVPLFLNGQNWQPVGTLAPSASPQGGDRSSGGPVISADGKTVVFLSSARNLVTNAPGAGALNVVVRGLVDQTNRLVSVGLGGEAGDGNSYYPAISANGRFVAFESAAANLVANDTNGSSDVFLRDLATDKTILVSVATSGVGGGNRKSFNPKITPDGSRVVFESQSWDLVNETVRTPNVYVRDLPTGTTRWVSTNSGIFGSTNSLSRDPVISDNGRFVAYLSLTSDNLHNPGGTLEFLLRDLESGTMSALGTNATTLFAAAPTNFNNMVLSSNGQFVAYRAFSTNGSGVFWQDLAPGGSNYTVASSSFPFLPDGDAAGPVMSADGQRLVFESGTNLVVWDAATQTSVRLGYEGSAFSPRLTGDGRFISFLGSGTQAGPGASPRIQLFIHDRISGTTQMVSSDGSGGGSSDVGGASMSADGSRFSFQAEDGNLVAGDFNRTSDVFFRDLSQGPVQLVSQHPAALASVTPIGPSLAAPNGISSNGQFIAFSSFADNVSAADTNGWPDIYLRDQLNGTNILVSVNTNGLSGNGLSHSPILSANGRYLVFASLASDLAPAGSDGLSHLYLRDVQAGTTLALPFSASPSPSPLPLPSISDDGLLVAYEGRSTPSETVSDAYLFDVRTSSATILNSVSGGTGGGYAPLISPDGRRVAFAESTYNASVPIYPSLTVLDLQTGKRDRILTNYPCSAEVFSGDSQFLAYRTYPGIYTPYASPFVRDLNKGTDTPVYWMGLDNSDPHKPMSLSRDGRFLVFCSVAMIGADRNSFRDLYQFDRVNGQTSLISQNMDGSGAGNAPSDTGMISADGRLVVFRSSATNLVPGVTTGISRIYLRDLSTRTTSLLSQSPAGTPDVNNSIQPYFSADGQTIVLGSATATLSPGDYNGSLDLFSLRLPGANLLDTDLDGLDDNWERNFFGDLAHNGLADTDGDGLSDLDEFRAGTDPNNATSFLRATLVGSPFNRSLTLRWPASFGLHYQVQFKNGLADNSWLDLGANITINGAIAQATDTSAFAAQKFYRIQARP